MAGDIAKRLKGRKILGVHIDAERQHFLKFETDEGAVVLACEGDCCSETWFADVINLEDLVGSTIYEVEEVDLPPPNAKDQRTRQDVDSIYGINLRSGRGSAHIVFRNSSNGYYGGSVHLATPANWASVKWAPVTGDTSW